MMELLRLGLTMVSGLSAFFFAFWMGGALLQGTSISSYSPNPADRAAAD